MLGTSVFISKSLLETCTHQALYWEPVHLSFHAIIQSVNCVAAVPWIKLYSYRPGASFNVHIKHQNEEKMWSQQLWPWHYCWCQRGCFDYFWDFHEQQSLGFTQNSMENKETSSELILWTEMPCWERSKLNDQIGWRWQRRPQWLR